MDPDLSRLLRHLPPRVAGYVGSLGPDLVELALDIGRPPVARFAAGFRVLDPMPIVKEEILFVVGSVGAFERDDRAGVEGTLHRLSLVRDRYGDPVGVTVRLGRHLTGVAEPLRRVLLDTGESVLLIGRPGSGKTTLLRDCTRILSEALGTAVVVVDSHNEIGGDGVVPHPVIGMARRLQVPGPSAPAPATQYDIMLIAVRNHFPEVVVVDEITTRREADAARTIARRGVRLLATAHGEGLGDIVHNPELAGLVGQPSSDGGRPRWLEPPIIGCAVEVRRDRTLAVHRDAAQAVDAVLAGAPASPDEIVPVPAAAEQRPAPRPPKVRTHDDIPESDPWGWSEDSA